jgi:adenosylcobinamide-phosphate guanylyltransferase
MCGGRGTRLNRGEKPLFEVGGEPMVERVLRALEASRVDDVHAVTSPYAPETAARLDGRVSLVETAGEGYVEDLTAALERVERPVLTAVSDLPLLTGELVDRALDAREGGGLAVCVPTALKEALGVSADATRRRDGHALSPTGLNIVGDDETAHVSHDARLAVNVNRPDDAAVAEVLVDGP